MRSKRFVPLFAAALWLCASGPAPAQMVPVPLMPGPTIALVCDGPGGVEEISEGLREVVSCTGIPLPVITENWSTGLGVIPDHHNKGNQLRAGDCLAQKVMLWRQRCPFSRIVLVGYSTGANVILLATAKLPPNSVDRIVLLAASVPFNVDLRPALHVSREGVDSFFSTQDSTFPTAVDFLAPDRCGGPAGGSIGFNGGIFLPMEPLLICKLRQYGWNPGWERVGHYGARHGYTCSDWLEAYVMPLITARCLYP